MTAIIQPTTTCDLKILWILLIFIVKHWFYINNFSIFVIIFAYFMQFKDIEGQRILINHLTDIIDQGRVSHAQLFHGATHAGSLAIAIAYAQYLNCKNRQHYDNQKDGLRADSCGTCPSCKKYQQLVHPDLHFIFPNTTTKKIKKNPSCEFFQSEFRDFLLEYQQTGSAEDWYKFLEVDNMQGVIREKDAADIIGVLNLMPYEDSHKVLIMWLPEKMNITAANELLKTIEEPIGKTLIIMVSEEPSSIIPTILSRTQRVVIQDNTPLSPEHNSQFAVFFVKWMRLLFKLNMKDLSVLIDEIHTFGREQQKQFLAYVLDKIRACFLNSVAGEPCNLHSGDEKFDTAFPSMITQRNIALINEAINNTIYAIERNAHSKIAFMDLSFKLSKYIKNR